MILPENREENFALGKRLTDEMCGVQADRPSTRHQTKCGRRLVVKTQVQRALKQPTSGGEFT